MTPPAVRPGLFGKLPAHGDFVRRGWDDATVAALDGWCAAAVALLDDEDDERHASCWCGWVPEGMLARDALHLGVVRSRDRVGRGFVLVAGVAGAGVGASAGAWRHAQVHGEALAAIVRAAAGGAYDAAAAFAAVSALTIAAGDGDAPAETRWRSGAATVAGGAVDAALLARLLRARVAA